MAHGDWPEGEKGGALTLFVGQWRAVAGGSRDLDVGELPVIAGLREDADEAQLDVKMKMARSTSPEDARGGDGRRPKSSVAGEMRWRRCRHSAAIEKGKKE